MRKNQITINIDMWDDEGIANTLTVYADSDSIWEAVCAAFNELTTELAMDGRRNLPILGRREHSWGICG